MDQEKLKIEREGISVTHTRVYALKMSSSDPDNLDYPFLLKLVEEWEEGDPDNAHSWYFDEGFAPEAGEYAWVKLTAEQFLDKCVELAKGEVSVLEFTEAK